MPPVGVTVGLPELGTPGALAVIVTTLPETEALNPEVVQGPTAVAAQLLIAFLILIASAAVVVALAAGPAMTCPPTVILEAVEVPPPPTVMVAVLACGYRAVVNPVMRIA
jgi:hypothetical protein